VIKTLQQCEPSRNVPCPCGSGLKFKKCCHDGYKDGYRLKATPKYNAGEYKEALVACRRHLCWYILSHRAHTAPFVARAPSEAEELLAIDIAALADLVDLLHSCYFRLGMSDEFPGTLNRLEDAVSDKRWTEKIAYFHALWWLVDRGNSEEAYNRISTVNISACSDPEILTLYLDVARADLPFAETVDVLDRICANTHQESYRLQYSCLKGVAYCLICEIDEGCEILDQAIARYRSAGAEKRSLYGDHCLARALHTLGAFRQDDVIVKEAVTEFQRLLDQTEEDGFSAEIRAQLACSLGECFAFLGDLQAAVEFYNASLQTKAEEITRIYLAKAHVFAGNPLAGRQALDAVKLGELSAANHYDFALACAALAAASREAADIERAKSELRKTRSNDPLFIQRRDQSLIRLLETTPRSDIGTFRTILRSLNRYVTLRPSIFGVGVDINKIIEDIDKPKDRKRI
jgi:tetratricopeptide (TPR) repeat protein